MRIFMSLWPKHFAFTFTCILGAANEYIKLCGRPTEDHLQTLHHRLHRAPEHLQELCVPVTNSASCHLRSAAQGDLQVLATRVTYGPRSFAACAPSSGTAFQPHFDTRHSTMTLTQIRSRLKTHLFGLADRSA